MSEIKNSSDHQSAMEAANVRMTLVARKGATIIELMKGGLTPTRAAEVAEISKSTVADWLRRGLAEQRRLELGESPDPRETIYMDFALGALKAESEAQSGLVLSWFREARQGDWKAAERFLAKRWPQEWGDNNTVKLEVSALGMQADASTHVNPEEDDLRKRSVLAALVEAGDLPATVLDAWDGNDVIEAEIIETDD